MIPDAPAAPVVPVIPDETGVGYMAAVVTFFAAIHVSWGEMLSAHFECSTRHRSNGRLKSITQNHSDINGACGRRQLHVAELQQGENHRLSQTQCW